MRRLLSGADGLPSFTKLITLVVVLSYLINRPIPELVAVVVLATASGGKVLSEYIAARFGRPQSAPTTEPAP